MAKIKHIAIRTPNPEKTAAFYKEVFRPGGSGTGESRLLSLRWAHQPGYSASAMTRAPVKAPRDVPGYAGIDHFGFLVDDVDETCKKLEEAGAKATMGRVDLGHASGSDSRSYYEIKYRGRR